jgi:hypothetical protein
MTSKIEKMKIGWRPWTNGMSHRRCVALTIRTGKAGSAAATVRLTGLDDSRRRDRRVIGSSRPRRMLDARAGNDLHRNDAIQTAELVTLNLGYSTGRSGLMT